MEWRESIRFRNVHISLSSLSATAHELYCGGLAIRYLILSLSPAPVAQMGSWPLEGRDHTNLRQRVPAHPCRLLVPRSTWSYRSAKPNHTHPNAVVGEVPLT